MAYDNDKLHADRGISMLHTARVIAAIVCVAAMISLSACSTEAWGEPRTAPAPIGTPAAGFIPDEAPVPEATIAPRPGSWDDVHPSPGYRVVLLSTSEDEPTQIVVEAVKAWAKAERVDLRTVEADLHDPIPGIVSALEMNSDLILTAGDTLIDPLATVTPNHLEQQFLIVGAELAEPTHNVTAADWGGASFRGEGMGQASVFDPKTFTPERCDDAIRAGTAAVLLGMTGVVLKIA